MIRFIALFLGFLSLSQEVELFPQGKESIKPPYVIDIAGSQKNHRVFRLSEIAEDVSYVPLETRTNALIGYGTIKPAGKYFIVGTYRQPVMLFTREGKYVRSIGSIGKGPGQYREPFRNQADPDKELLYILGSDNKRIFKYSFNGQLLKDILVPYNCTDFYRFGNGNLLLATPSNYKADGFYPFVLLDPEGKLIKEILSIEAPTGKRIAYNATPEFKTGSNGWVIVSNFGRDIIYQISPAGDIKPYATLLLGKLKAPDEYYYDLSKWILKPFGFFAMGFTCNEVGPLLEVWYAYEMKSHIGYYDPRINKMAFRDSTESGETGFHNDLDGGPTFGDGQFWEENNNLYTFFMAVDLKLNRDFYAKQEALNPEKKKAMLEMIDSLDENDNPVIMIIKLK